MVTINSINSQNPIQVAVGGTGAATLTGVCIGNGTSAISATNYPQVSGLGIGASPGSTAGLTFDGSNFMNAYVYSGTFSPTIQGATSGGTTTYTTQSGFYTIIGGMCFIYGEVACSAATGTGNLTLGGFPETIKNQTNGYVTGAITILSSNTWPVSSTYCTLQGTYGTATAVIKCCGSVTGQQNMQLANTSWNMTFSLAYNF